MNRREALLDQVDRLIERLNDEGSVAKSTWHFVLSIHKQLKAGRWLSPAQEQYLDSICLSVGVPLNDRGAPLEDAVRMRVTRKTALDEWLDSLESDEVPF